MSSEAMATLEAEVALLHGGGVPDPHGWPLLAGAVLEVELPELIGKEWAAEIPWVVEHALALVLDRLPCLLHAAKSDSLTADCKHTPAEYLSRTLTHHLMAALPY